MHRKPLTACERRWAEEGTSLYFAYGMNIPLGTMPREPHATRLGAALLRDWRLCFRVYADIEEAPGEVVHGALWRLDADALRAMDCREGYHPDRADNMYDRIEVEVETADGPKRALVYRMGERMRANASAGASDHYVAILREGYAELGMPEAAIDTALAYAKASAGFNEYWSESFGDDPEEGI